MQKTHGVKSYTQLTGGTGDSTLIGGGNSADTFVLSAGATEDTHATIKNFSVNDVINLGGYTVDKVSYNNKGTHISIDIGGNETTAITITGLTKTQAGNIQSGVSEIAYDDIQ